MQLASAARATAIVGQSSVRPRYSTSCLRSNRRCIGIFNLIPSFPGLSSTHPRHCKPGKATWPWAPHRGLVYTPYTLKPSNIAARCRLLYLRPTVCLHIQAFGGNNCGQRRLAARVSCCAGKEGEEKNLKASRVNGSWEASEWEGRHKYRMTISYDGTGLAGWQLQSHALSGQHLVETALGTLTRSSRSQLLLVAAGRTDAGVHARGQVVHFWSENAIPDLFRLIKSLNAILPPTMKVVEVAEVPHLFHARYSAQRKVYHYRVHNAAVLDPFKRLYALHISQRLNIEDIRTGAKLFEGEHDFAAFANTSDIKERDPVRTISRFEVEPEEGGFRLEVEGSGFLYKQVRNMVGVLLAIGKGSVEVDMVPRLLQSRDRSLVARLSTTAPPHGLILHSVLYPTQLLHTQSEIEKGVRLSGGVEHGMEHPRFDEPKNKRVYKVDELGEVVAHVTKYEPRVY